jgi:prepilin-type processing-associated H-X9-DG protein
MLNIAFIMYTNDDKQKSMYWSGALPATIQNPNATVDWVFVLQPYYKADAVRLCPEAVTYSADPGPNTMVYNFGAASQAWSNRMANTQTFWAFGSYTFNGWLFRNEPDTINILQQDGVANAGTGLFNLPAKSSTNVPVFCDSIWFTAWPQPTDTPAPNNSGGAYFTGSDASMATANQMQRVQLARHKKFINVGYLDGHAAPIALNQLWLQQWRADWVAPTPLPAIPN